MIRIRFISKILGITFFVALSGFGVQEDIFGEQGKFWPGMWLMDRSGNRIIHVKTDGTPQSGVPGLIEALKNKDPGIRESAITWLGDIGNDAISAIPALKAALNDPDPAVRAEASIALAKVKKQQ